MIIATSIVSAMKRNNIQSILYYKIGRKVAKTANRQTKSPSEIDKNSVVELFRKGMTMQGNLK